MILNHPQGVSPAIEMAIDGAAVDYQAIGEIELCLEENKHDMLTFRIAGLPVRASADYRNRPVRVLFSTGAKYIEEFNGYVIETQPVNITKDGQVNRSPFQESKIVCLGSSYVMRGARSRTWHSTPLHEVALEFAEHYGFSVDVPSVPCLNPTIVQSAESDWQFLVRYAGMYGFSVTLHGTHLHVFDPFQAAGRGISFHRLITTKDMKAVRPHPGNLTVFDARLAEHHPDGRYKDTIATVHPDNGAAFDVTLRELRGLSAPARFEDRLSTHTSTYEQAVRAINARSRSLYDFQATAECLGLAGCKPGGIVNVDKYGSEVDGLWYVGSVKHTINSSVYLTELDLKRNINSELTLSTPVQRFSTPSTAAVVNSVWRASKRNVNVYS